MEAVSFPAPLGGELFLDQILAAASMVDRELASQAEVIVDPFWYRGFLGLYQLHDFQLRSACWRVVF